MEVSLSHASNVNIHTILCQPIKIMVLNDQSFHLIVRLATYVHAAITHVALQVPIVFRSALLFQFNRS